jgi:hypothetical protein
MADYTQLHHDNGYGFLQWNPFSDYMQTGRGEVEGLKFTLVFNVGQFSAKLILKRSLRRYLNGQKNKFTLKQVLP